MSKHIEKQKYLLQELLNCELKIRKANIKNADRDLINAICESVFNLLEGNINISDTQKGLGFNNK